MFPKELLIARARNGKVKPSLIDPFDTRIPDLVQKVVEAGIGKRRSEIEHLLREEEEKIINYKVLRGFYHLIARRCIFVQKTNLEPEKIRKEIYKLVPAGAVTPEERADALQKVANMFFVTPDQIDDAIYADIEENYILESVSFIDKSELVRQYNLEQIETLLMKATHMEIRINDGYMDLIREIKHKGLMFTAEKRAAGVTVVVDGPLSLMLYTDKYGSAMSSLIKYIAGKPSWSVTAEINYSGSTGKKLVTLELNDAIASYLPAVPALREEENMEYRQLVNDLNMHNSNLKAKLLSEPAVVGSRLYFPELEVKAGNITIYVDFLRYWSPEYIKAREQFFQMHNVNLLTIPVNNGNCTTEVWSDSYRENEIDHSLVERLLRKNFKVDLDNIPSKHISFKKSTINGNEPIIDLESSIVDEHTMAKLTDNGYIRKGTFLVRADILPKIKMEIERLIPSYARITLLFAESNINVEAFLTALGYRVVWKNLEDVYVEK